MHVLKDCLSKNKDSVLLCIEMMIRVTEGVPWVMGPCPPDNQMDDTHPPIAVATAESGPEGVVIGFPVYSGSHYHHPNRIAFSPPTLWDDMQVVHVIQMANPDGRSVVDKRYPVCGCPCAEHHTTMCGLIPVQEMKQVPPALVGALSQLEWAEWCGHVNDARHAHWPEACASVGLCVSILAAAFYNCYTDRKRRTVYRRDWEKLAERGLIWQRWFPEHAAYEGAYGPKDGMSEQLRLVYSPYWHHQYKEFQAGRGPSPPVARIAEEYWVGSKEVGIPPFEFA